MSVVKFVIRLSQVETLLKNLESGKAFATKRKNANIATPEPMIKAIYFNGYLPINVSIKTIAKINAVVEKFAGRINTNVINTGIQS
ncbi:hypothetical protein D3C80_1391670 [compost metagenome]